MPDAMNNMRINRRAGVVPMDYPVVYGDEVTGGRHRFALCLLLGLEEIASGCGARRCSGYTSFAPFRPPLGAFLSPWR
jgi:hypothetical protein